MMATEACLLSWLIEKPAHGYELQRLLRLYGEVHAMINVNVYALLRSLEAKGWVLSRTEIKQARMRKIYEITAQGRAEFDRWLNSPIAELRPKTSDPVMLRMLLSTDLDRDSDWLRDAIADTEERRKVATAQYEKDKPRASRVVRMAAEEVIASLDRRLAFLARAVSLIQGNGSTAVSKSAH